MPRELLTPAAMAQADRLAMAAGVPGHQLMLAAGRAVADVITTSWAPRHTGVLCGPGNNGGDGFVVARLLHEQGWPVRVGLLGSPDALTGDALHHAQRWPGDIEPLSVSLLEGCGLVVDALFGAGLSRPLEGLALQVIQTLQDSGLPVCAIDMPSGVDGATGAVLGAAAQATHTVTFFRKKPGHLLLPGRALCGQVTLADIGIPEAVLAEVPVAAHENHVDAWRHCWPLTPVSTHKYQRGHVLVRGGAQMTGAARLAALAAARMGAGLVTVAAPREVWPVYASALTSVMVSECSTPAQWHTQLQDARRNALVIGPGAGMSSLTREEVLAALQSDAAVVLDADALSAFAEVPQDFFRALRMPAVLTPHEGEFARLFPFSGSKLERARAAARQTGVIVVLKGADTIIAAPDGRVLINANAPVWLATAGSGDVLSGMIAGLLAQNMPAFEAAAAAVWLHGAAAARFGPGLIADDLPSMIPCVLRDIVVHD
ncbi:MAG: NAD(P)H-hydrate dehydratase [Castellaniella sp.]